MNTKAMFSQKVIKPRRESSILLFSSLLLDLRYRIAVPLNDGTEIEDRH